MGGRMDGWMGGKAGLRIAYSNQQIGWMDGKAGLQHSKNFVTELMDE